MKIIFICATSLQGRGGKSHAWNKQQDNNCDRCRDNEESHTRSK